jgi:nucleotide-binding universal stress UspA family protein
MLPFKRILFPVDFSAQSIGAARYAEAFAGRFDAELILLHVVDLPQYNDLRPQSPAERRAHLDSFLKKELDYFRVERISAEGDSARNILRIARERSVDLIMMPTHGHGPFRRFLLGSVTAKVLHDADCAVWTGVHLESAPPLEKIEIHRLLCAVNLDAHAEVVLKTAYELAAEYRAELTVLHVGSESARRQIAAENVVIESGEVAGTVASVAHRTKADLLLIGRSSDPGMFGRLRTHAYPIIRQSPCPVISV